MDAPANGARPTAPLDEVAEDLGTIVKRPVVVQFNGASYRVQSVLDLEIQVAAELHDLEDRKEKAATAAEVFEICRRQMRTLCLDWPDEVRERLTLSQIQRIIRIAFGSPPRPRTAGALDSSSTSPAPPASTVGATTI